jgi:hypothetical protein
MEPALGERPPYSSASSQKRHMGVNSNTPIELRFLVGSCLPSFERNPRVKRRTLISIVIGLASLLCAPTALARDQIRIVGSSTVFPFSTAVAEQFGRSTDFKTPIVESTGSGGGIKLFCSGIGDSTPDIANASRRIKPSEVERCNENGVTEVVEIRLGYDSWEWADRALLRAFEWLDTQANYPAEGDDTWLPHIVNRVYQVNLPAEVPSVPGKGMGFADWTHAQPRVESPPSGTAR